MTGRDNKTHDIARWSWMITTIVVICGAIYNAFEGNNFGIRDFAESIGIITGAHGAAVLMKKDAEPELPEKSIGIITGAHGAAVLMKKDAEPEAPEKSNGDSDGR